MAPVTVYTLDSFRCTGYTRETHEYFMKASPERPGDFIEFFAEIDLLAGVSTCPGGDCGAAHPSDVAKCYPLRIDIFRPRESVLADWQPWAPNGYGSRHSFA